MIRYYIIIELTEPTNPTIVTQPGTNLPMVFTSRDSAENCASKCKVGFIVNYVGR